MDNEDPSKEHARLLGELAAAQLVEQVKHIGTSQIAIPIVDQSEGWIVRVKKVGTDRQSDAGDHDGHHEL